MSFYDPLIWRSSYLLEFKDGDVPVDAFMFSVPPQSEEFTFPQRVKETKTFGGSVIDDYGNDTFKITLSGSTINNDLRLIRRQAKASVPKWVTGWGEVQELQKVLETYGMCNTEEDVLKINNKKVYLYQLSMGFMQDDVAGKYFRVAPLELQVRRDKSAPFSYNYTFSCIAWHEGRPKFKNSLFEAIVGGITDGLNTLSSLARTLKSVLNFSNPITQVADKLTRAVNDAFSIVDNTTRLIAKGTAELSITPITETVKVFDTVIKSSVRATLRSQLEVYTAIKEVASVAMEACGQVKDLVDDCGDEYKTMWQAIEDEYGEAIADTCVILDCETEGAAALIVTLAGFLGGLNSFALDAMDEGSSVFDKYGDSVIVTSNGCDVKRAKGAMTWDELARVYLGSAKFADLLATYNAQFNSDYKTSWGDVLPVGARVLIPTFVKGAEVALNTNIHNGFGVIDKLGVDMRLDNDGDLAISGGDFALVNKEDNLMQSVLNRLLTIEGSLTRHEYIGTNAKVGTSIDKTLLRASVERTLMNEERIKSVDNIVIDSGIEDAYKVNVTYTSVEGNSQKVTFGG